MNKKKLKRILFIIMAAIILPTTGILTYAAYQYNHLFNRIYVPIPEADGSTDSGIIPILDVRQLKNLGGQLEEEDLEPFIMLLVGVDSRGEEHARSDTIILSVVNPKNKKVTLISLPRDTLVNLPKRGQEKLNHTTAFGGIPLLKESIEDLFDVPIQRYATIDFEGFRKLIDELGGVEVDVKRRLKYYDPTDGTKIDLHPGVQVLDGKNALDYVRHRHDDRGARYFSSDFDRHQRQQEVIRAIVDKGKDFTSLLKIFSIMDIVGDHLKTDLQKNEIELLAKRFKDFSSEGIETVTIQGKDQYLPYGDQTLYFFVVSDQEKKRIKEILLHALREESKTSEENDFGENITVKEKVPGT